MRCLWNDDDVRLLQQPGNGELRGRRANVVCNRFKRRRFQQSRLFNRRISHRWNAAFALPRQQIKLNAASREVVEHLIGSDLVSVWNGE